MNKTLAAVLFMLVANTALPQGLLQPPGTPAPLMRTLDQVYDIAKGAAVPVNQTNTPGDADAVFVISQPGAYYLPQSFTGESGKYGIQVTSPNVTLDLGGNKLTGVAGALRGVSAGTDTTVRNGSLRSWPFGGVLVGARGHAEKLTVYGCGDTSIQCALSGIITDCIVDNSTFVAFGLGDSSIIERCVAYQTTGTAILHGDSCLVKDCIVRNATLDGISQGSGGNSIIEGNVVSGCTQKGITVCATSEIRGNAVATSTTGIDLRCGGNVVADNKLSNNTTGITLGDNNKEQVYHNTFRGNTTNVPANTGNYVAPLAVVSAATNPFSNLTSP